MNILVHVSKSTAIAAMCKAYGDSDIGLGRNVTRSTFYSILREYVKSYGASCEDVHTGDYASFLPYAAKLVQKHFK
jgi:hypothetical protein